VIVAAEGAGQDLIHEAAAGADASGTAKLHDVGLFLKQRIADHFAPEEARFLAGLQDDEAAAVFYRLWTCKEACLKCLGTGIGGGGPTLADVVIALNPDGTVSGTARTASGRSWRVASWTPCPGSTAAVAVPAAEGSTSGENLSLVVDLQPIEPESTERAVSRVAAPPPGRAPGAP
jgi:phosphopantetheinyl transferase (holo-ACP synthase)